MTNSDPRFADIITTFDPNTESLYDVVIFGIPSDEGIRRNGGRIGASHAPNAIRTYLHRLTPYSGTRSAISLRIADAGDACGSTLEEMDQDAVQKIEHIITTTQTLIILGGGHDITLPGAIGMSSVYSQSPFALINIDAHLDVRPKKDGLHHSGSSFRLLIESGIVRGKDLIEFGIQDHSFSAEHLQWVRQQGAEVIFYNDIRQSHLTVKDQFISVLQHHSSAHYISFDIDAIRSADAPGCSAPSPIGLTADEAVSIASVSGSDPSVKVFDIAEVSPGYDVDGHTCRLAARMAAAFITGVSNR
jgi:formiminoglutamase